MKFISREYNNRYIWRINLSYTTEHFILLKEKEANQLSWLIDNQFLFLFFCGVVPGRGIEVCWDEAGTPSPEIYYALDRG